MDFTETTRHSTIGELEVAKELLKLGCSVFKEIADNSPIDLIAIKHNSLVKIQVKTICLSADEDYIKVKFAKNGHGKGYVYTKDVVDYIAAYDMRTGNVYWVKVSEVGGIRSVIRLRVKPTTQKSKVRDAQDYLAPPF